MTIKGMSAFKVLALAAGIVLVMCLGVWVLVKSAEARMLRPNADNVAADPGLVRMAQFLGAQVFSAHCAACHGANAKGSRETGVPDLTDSEWVFGSGKVSDIEQTVSYGIRARHSKTKNLASMPAFGRADPYGAYKVEPLTPAQIDDVVEYLVFMEGKPADREKVGRGAVIYNGKAACFDCHSQDGKGDDFIGAPDLTNSVAIYGDGGKAALHASIALGRGGICPAWILDLPASAIREVSIYVQTLSSGASKTKQVQP